MTTLWLAAGNALARLVFVDKATRVDLLLLGKPVRCVAVDPLRPELLYCGTFGEGLWRSEDSGENWEPVGKSYPHSQVLSVAVSASECPHGCGIVYAGSEPSEIYRSKDAGLQWHECEGLTELPSADEWSFPPRPETHHVRWIQPDLRSDALFVAIEAGALVTSPNAGDKWCDRQSEAPIDTHQLAMHPKAKGRLYAAAGDGYFESTDNGKRWTQIHNGLKHHYVWSVAVDSGDPETVIVSVAAGPRQSHDVDEAESHLYRKHGDEWELLHEGLPEGKGRRTALLAAHPKQAGTFFAAWEEELYRSTDGGQSWEEIEIPWPDEYQVDEPHQLVVLVHES
ncbi:WD40/YVTN/BNR-like repeat-containing protein [Rubinisphaera margarita]|uniref:WD40/YVTN/BNR-like repeat-containing protein n=1 Tax=Rubinisphaera margarita TaxID=2909586 RepID=UPI001EE84834|nr:sialidase family protein [Rubinisphaera margarita]MCG6155679.1 hypothetical protein [Rubinisphaera margarita]